MSRSDPITPGLKYTLVVESLLKNEDKTYVNLLPPIYEELDIDDEKKVKLYNFVVDKYFKEGIYQLKIRMIIENNVAKEISKEFTISDTLKEFDFSLNFCKDQACTEKAKVFILNETIYFNYKSIVPEILVIGLLTRPNKSIRELTLPNAELASQIGTYKLEVEASKEGYKTKKVEAMFGVIEKMLQIPSAVGCVVDGVCNVEETLKNCPQDCALVDTDNDGVPNYKDKCPNTPQGQIVDEEGCFYPQ